MKITTFGLFVMLAGCGSNGQSESEPTQAASQSEKTELAIEVKYLGFPTEDPHFATYRLEDGTLEFELHKSDRPVRKWDVSSEQLEGLKAVIDSVDHKAWSGIYWEPVLDGGMVYCTIRSGRSEFEFEGLNAFPPCFAELLNAMDAIAGEQVGAFWKMPLGLHFESMKAMGEVGSEEIQRMLNEKE